MFNVNFSYLVLVVSTIGTCVFADGDYPKFRVGIENGSTMGAKRIDVPNASAMLVPFNGTKCEQEFDIGRNVNRAPNCQYGFSAPEKGFYQFTATMRLMGSDITNRLIRITKNQKQISAMQTQSKDSFHDLSSTVLVKMEPGDCVQVYAYVDNENKGDRYIVEDQDNSLSYFTGFRLPHE